MLPLPLVPMGPDHVAVVPAELGVRDQEGLDVVVPRRQFTEARYRIPKRGPVDHGRLSRCEAFDVRGEERNPARVRHRLVSETPLPDRGDLGPGADHHVDAAGHRAGMERARKGDLETRLGRLRIAAGKRDKRRGE